MKSKVTSFARARRVLLLLAFLQAFAFSWANAQGLHEAVLSGNIAQVDQLLSSGADVNQLDSNGRTALILASNAGNHQMVQFLLDRQAGIEVSGPGGETPLIAAASHGFISVVQLLLDRGADPWHADDQLMNALDHSVEANWESAQLSTSVDFSAVVAILRERLF